MEKNTKKHTFFNCENCAFSCDRKPDWKRHLGTSKHIKLINVNETLIQPAQQFICGICSKEYKSNVGLWKHKKTCTIAPPTNPGENTGVIKLLINENKELINENKELINDNKDFKNIILEMMKSNTDLQNKMMDMCKNSNNTTIHKNSHNKTFNMQIFLNEHCKDAMNIKDFADSFQLQISDLEKVGHLGYVDGISDIIIKKLNDMDIYKRPIHCSDTKRDTMYVHADDVWTKENSDHEQVRALVQRITAKNIRLIPIWQDMYPQSRNNMHKLNDTYMSLTRQAMGGFGGTIPENESKIIKKIAKTVFIDKNM
jgi:hypothetical protein